MTECCGHAGHDQGVAWLHCGIEESNGAVSGVYSF